MRLLPDAPDAGVDLGVEVEGAGAAVDAPPRDAHAPETAEPDSARALVLTEVDDDVRPGSGPVDLTAASLSSMPQHPQHGEGKHRIYGTS
jgi:hypothetical protein